MALRTTASTDCSSPRQARLHRQHHSRHMSIANSGVHSSSRPQKISDHLGQARHVQPSPTHRRPASGTFGGGLRGSCASATAPKPAPTQNSDGDLGFARMRGFARKANFHQVSPYRWPGDEVSLRTTRQSSSTRRHASDHSSLDMCVI